METETIKKLLHKYDKGFTTLKEEELLRTYFVSTKTIPDSWLVYRSFFGYFNEASAIALSNTEKKWFSFRPWMAVAAMLAIAVTLYLNPPSNSSILTPKEQELYYAFDQFQNNIKRLSLNLNKGTQQLAYLDYWDQTTKKLIK